ncbi:MAG: DMT family transporter [Candidatus Kerfeldbacteria bacterium]|nr:DMT family transporter [Candidatus Kerfeldbacteria bacterium]
MAAAEHNSFWPSQGAAWSSQSLYIVLAAILWSTDALLRQPLTRDLSALVIVFAEHALALIFVAPILYTFGYYLRRLTARQWAAVLFIGVAASALATVAFTASFSYVSPSVSILLQKVQPLITFGVAWFWLGERLPRHFWLWAGLALLGAYVVSFPELIPQLTLYQGGVRGIGLALLAAVLWGSATVAGRYLLRELPFLLVTSLRFMVALVFLGLLLSGGTLNSGWGQLASASMRDWLFLLVIMLGPGFGAMYLYYRGLTVTKAAVAAVLELTWPLGAVILNWFILGEHLTLGQMMGGLILMVAIGRLTLWPTVVQTN